MAAMFTGASRALLASIIFTFEVTHQPSGVLPVLAGCTSAYLVSALLMQTSIMTEKLARRGSHIRTDYTVDFLSQLLVQEVMTREVMTLQGEEGVAAVQSRLFSESTSTNHQCYPVLDQANRLMGVVSYRQLVEHSLTPEMKIQELIGRDPVVTHQDNTLREAADHMVREGVG